MRARSTVSHRKRLLALVRAGCENRSGVYRMLDPTGAVIYVGQSRTLRTRLLSYFRAKGRRNKAARIMYHTFGIEWEYAKTPFGALLRELRLIKIHRPPFNAVMVRDDSTRGYVALTRGPVPGLRVVTRSDDPDAVSLFGPFRRVRQLRQAVRALAEAMSLRDCTLEASTGCNSRHRASDRLLWFAGHSPEIGLQESGRRRRTPVCLRHELGTCAGPCIGAGDAGDYSAAAAEVRAFLEGRNDIPLRRLTIAMDEASAALSFERARILRDRLVLVQWLHGRVQHFAASVDRLTFRYHTHGTDGREWIYLIRRGTVRAEVAAPSSTSDHESFRSLIERTYASSDRTDIDVPTHDLEEFLLVASWFRKYPAERARTFAPYP